MSRDEAIAGGRGAGQRARRRGRRRRAARWQTVDVEDMPLAYLPGNALRVRVRVVGDVAGS